MMPLNKTARADGRPSLFAVASMFIAVGSATSGPWRIEADDPNLQMDRRKNQSSIIFFLLLQQ